MPDINFTPEQDDAIHTIDRSVLVTAAAGSGKTAVLAARCAYLVCDAPKDSRCPVDQLLVVTFTEAAAAEMRSRIHKEIRQRLEARPHDSYLRAQLALLNTAQISTIHAFCLWTLRRWFNLVGIDPAAAILDEDEARLLQSDTIEQLFADLYDPDAAQGHAFRTLVADYGLARDDEIAAFVRRVAAFCDSLPDPEAWLQNASDRATNPDTAIDELTQQLADELALQHTECSQLARFVITSFPVAAFYGHRLEDYATQLAAWRAQLTTSGFDAVQPEINEYALSSQGAPRFGKNAPPEHTALRDQARDVFDTVKKTLFETRLRERFARFTRAELTEGLAAIAPYTQTIIELVRAFRQRYATAKRELAALDFADLERFAYDLLSSHTDVAQDLRQRFAHVLVDEFQDINPLQEAILKHVSREPDPAQPDNLFAVGDVKQSIYRFRLAEPVVLLDRQRAFTADDASGHCIALQHNFRSRRSVIDGVNLLFRSLMQPGAGDIEYDEHAELRQGRSGPDDAQCPPIELHLLERKPTSEENEDKEEARFIDPADPTQWTAIQREAHLIASKIRDLIRNRETTDDDEPLTYKDIVILLRAAAHTAGPMADMLTRMGVPAHAPAAGEFLDALEIRDLIALLETLDNPRQDIPLAAVMRSGVLGQRFTEDDLVSIRGISREIPFPETLSRYAQRGTDKPLRTRVADLLRTIDNYRSAARQLPLADVLWHIYQKTGYLAYVGGLEGGPQRRANLLNLHERARQFGTFQRQGLHRFLRFIDSLRQEDRDLRTPPAESENAVRIISIHQAKGLEFPVVFVADLGRRFNLSDAAGRMILDRNAGIGLRVLDRDRMIEHPSALHHLVARQVHTATRNEELRVLYVALTRAKDRLFLVGSTDMAVANRKRQRWQTTGAHVSPPTILTAGTPLDWLVPVLAAQRDGQVHWPDQAAWKKGTGSEPNSLHNGEKSHPRGACPLFPTFTVTAHTETEMANWRLEESDTASEDSARAAVAALDPLPKTEPTGPSAEQADEIVARLDYAYPHLAASSVRAVIAASELKRPLDTLQDPDAQHRDRLPHAPALDVPSLSGATPAATARQRGTTTHLLLQNLRLNDLATPQAIGAQAQRLVTEGLLETQDANTIDVDAVAWFFTTDLGRRIQNAGDAYRREVMFLATEPAEAFDPTIARASDVPVVVRGIADGLLTTDNALEIVDYKTDRITTDQVPDRARTYAGQVQLYASAMARIWKRPVRRCWLVFLHPRQVIDATQD